jgi:hypothetical protein
MRYWTVLGNQYMWWRLSFYKLNNYWLNTVIYNGTVDIIWKVQIKLHTLFWLMCLIWLLLSFFWWSWFEYLWLSFILFGKRGIKMRHFDKTRINYFIYFEVFIKPFEMILRMINKDTLWTKCLILLKAEIQWWQRKCFSSVIWSVF